MEKLIRKVVRLGTVQYAGARRIPIFCKIEYQDGRLSLSGVEGPTHDGNCRGSCGQIVMHLRGCEESVVPATGWDTATLKQFFSVWDRWHLNDLTAGSPAQEEFLRQHRAEWESHKAALEGACPDYYTWACKALAAAGLHPDPNCGDYRYGSAWRKVDVPDDVLAWLRALPDTDVQPAWV